MKDKYKEPITIMFPDVIARVYFPILDAEEKKRRMKNLHRASANIVEGVKK